LVPLAMPIAQADGGSQVALAVTKASSLEATLEAVARGDGRGTYLTANTLLAGEKLFDATAGRPAVWSVEVLDGSRRRGFVLAADVIRLSQQLDNLKKGERSLRRSFGQLATQPPRSITSHKNEQLREAWREATEAITANNALPAAQRLPDPYLARAEVYMQAGDVVAALDDCAAASAIVAANGLDSRKQQQAAEIYTNAIKQLRSLPQPPRDAFTDIDMQASEHFNASQRFIAQRDFDKAISELAKALSLTPSQPLYWYMRAVARRESGDLHRAQSDAIFGALFERRLSPPARHEVSKALTRIQGSTRLWLEAYRRGKAEVELMGLDL
jgi:tetratricopeptide (TPR) repeat protein